MLSSTAIEDILAGLISAVLSNIDIASEARLSRQTIGRLDSCISGTHALDTDLKSGAVYQHALIGPPIDFSTRDR